MVFRPPRRLSPVTEHFSSLSLLSVLSSSSLLFLLLLVVVVRLLLLNYLLVTLLVSFLFLCWLCGLSSKQVALFLFFYFLISFACHHRWTVTSLQKKTKKKLFFAFFTPLCRCCGFTVPFACYILDLLALSFTVCERATKHQGEKLVWKPFVIRNS